METLKPIILLSVLFLILVSGCQNPIVDPNDYERPARVLIIGTSSQEVLNVMNNYPDLVDYIVQDASALGENPMNQLLQYDIIILDQSQQSDKAVSRVLGEAIANYVNNGGNLITVMDSGIYRKGAPDIVGWYSTFNDTIPVRCDRVLDNQPICEKKISVYGIIRVVEIDHNTVNGIEQVPQNPDLRLRLETFDLSVVGKEIAYIEDPATHYKYPGIIENRMLIGKSIFFNYNPGLTPEILKNTLQYMTE